MMRELFTSLQEREKRKEIHVINQKTILIRNHILLNNFLTIKNIKEKHMI